MAPNCLLATARVSGALCACCSKQAHTRNRSTWLCVASTHQAQLLRFPCCKLFLLLLPWLLAVPSHSAPVVQVTLVSGSVRTVIARVNSTTNWVDQIIKPSVPWSGVSSVEVTCTASFTLTEIALQGARCFEQATLDLQAVSSINMIRCAVVCGCIARTHVLTLCPCI